jgi:hypothetical protein
MGGSSKAAAAKSSSPSRQLKRQRMWNSSSGRKSKKKATSGSGGNSPGEMDSSAAESLFLRIADEDDPQIASMEGICKLCEDLDLDPLEDVRVLVLLWKLGANEKPAQISKVEWMQGCNKLQIDSVPKFKTIKPSLDLGFLETADFKDFYKVCGMECNVYADTRCVGIGRMIGTEPYICFLSFCLEVSHVYNNNNVSSHAAVLFLFSFVFSSIDRGRIGPWTRKW